MQLDHHGGNRDGDRCQRLDAAWPNCIGDASRREVPRLRSCGWQVRDDNQFGDRKESSNCEIHIRRCDARHRHHRGSARSIARWKRPTTCTSWPATAGCSTSGLRVISSGGCVSTNRIRLVGSQRNNVTNLAYFERYGSVMKAIHREKELKDWQREKKIALIESNNPKWRDLSYGWYQSTRLPPLRKIS
jgi:hypothetical protein